MARKTPIGIEAKRLTDAGQLVSDDVVINMFQAALDDTNSQKGWVLVSR
jgi:adenylate kinase